MYINANFIVCKLEKHVLWEYALKQKHYIFIRSLETVTSLLNGTYSTIIFDMYILQLQNSTFFLMYITIFINRNIILIHNFLDRLHMSAFVPNFNVYFICLFFIFHLYIVLKYQNTGF